MLELASSIKETKPVVKTTKSNISKEKKLIQMLTDLDISKDIAIPLVEDVLRDYPNIAILAMLSKIINQFDKKEVSKSKPKLNLIKQNDWNTLPSEDLRFIYSESKGQDIYNAFKKKGIILDFDELIKETTS